MLQGIDGHKTVPWCTCFCISHGPIPKSNCCTYFGRDDCSLAICRIYSGTRMPQSNILAQGRNQRSGRGRRAAFSGLAMCMGLSSRFLFALLSMEYMDPCIFVCIGEYRATTSRNSNRTAVAYSYQSLGSRNTRSDDCISE